MVPEIYIKICLKSLKKMEREKKNHEQLGIHWWKSMKTGIFFLFIEKDDKVGNILTSLIKLIEDFYQLAFMTHQNRDRIFFF